VVEADAFPRLVAEGGPLGRCSEEAVSRWRGRDEEEEAWKRTGIATLESFAQLKGKGSGPPTETRTAPFARTTSDANRG